MRVFIKAGLAVVAATALAACSTPGPSAASHRRAHPHDAKLVVDVPAPPAGSRPEAAALARLVLARLSLPAGARRLPPTPVPAALQQPTLLGLTAASLDVHELFELPQSMSTAASFLAAHKPKNMMLFSSGSAGDAAGPQNQAVSYLTRSVPAGLYEVLLDLTVAPDGYGGSVLRADAQVVWYPPRTAAEYIDPARYRALTITVTTYGTRPHTVRTVVTSPAAIARLADVLDRSQVLPARTISCTLGLASYQLAFAVAAHSRPVVVVDAAEWPCEGAQIRVGGRWQPSLQDAASVVSAVDRLLRLRP